MVIVLPKSATHLRRRPARPVPIVPKMWPDNFHHVDIHAGTPGRMRQYLGKHLAHFRNSSGATTMISGREMNLERQRAEDRSYRYSRLHGEFVEQLEQTALEENHGIIYILIGWQHWLACMTANFLMDVLPAYPWLHFLPWPIWVGVALLSVRYLREPAPMPPTLLGEQLAGLSLAFLLLGGATLGLTFLGPLATLGPAVLALLSAFLLGALTVLVTRRFLTAALLLFAAGLASALVPTFGFAIYGCSWVIVLQTLGLELVRKRRIWLAEELYRNHVLPFIRLGS